MILGEPLTTSDILAAASDTLREGGYVRIAETRLKWPTTNARFFEDPYGIVAVFVYETWTDLSTGWANAQAALVELISDYISSTEAKAWDGYLVLLTPGIPGTGDRLEPYEIRYDTSRLRKLVATGEELRGLSDIERTLLPLLPLRTDIQLQVQQAVLELLPELLSQRGLPEDAVRVLINAFSEQQPLLERLHYYRTQT